MVTGKWIILLLPIFLPISFSLAFCSGEIPDVEAQIAFVKEAKQFGENILGIKPNKLFEVYSENLQEKTIYVLYWFPRYKIPQDKKDLFRLWGEKIYEGDDFWINLKITNNDSLDKKYSKKMLEFFKTKLLEDKMDIFEREYTVSSQTKEITPLFLSFSQVDQAMLIFHEGFHNMVDNIEFNKLRSLDILEEAIASIIGFQGAILFTSQKFGISSPQYLEALKIFERSKQKADFINIITAILNGIYQSDFISNEEKQKMIERLMAEIACCDKEYKEWREAPLNKWDRIPPPEIPNPLFFIYHSTYTKYFPLIAAVYEKINNPKEFIELVVKKMPVSSEQAAVDFLKNFLLDCEVWEPPS